MVNKPKSSTKETNPPETQGTPSRAAPSVIENPNPEPAPRPHAPPPHLQRPAPPPPYEAFGLSTEQYEMYVQEMVGMGYPRSDVETALQVSFYNPDRAVEYLLNGIPQALTGQAAGGAHAEGHQQEDRERLAFFRNSPQFLQLRTLVQQDPSLLAGLLQDLGQSNPALFEAIRDNQEEFLAMLNAPLPAGAAPVVQTQSAATGSRPAAGIAPAGLGQAPRAAASGPVEIRVTAEEREAIERLKSLGFDEGAAVEAYFACDKNEQQAADFLFSQLDEEQGSSQGHS